MTKQITFKRETDTVKGCTIYTVIRIMNLSTWQIGEVFTADQMDQQLENICKNNIDIIVE